VVYKHTSDEREAVTILDITCGGEDTYYTVFLPSLGREKQTSTLARLEHVDCSGSTDYSCSVDSSESIRAPTMEVGAIEAAMEAGLGAAEVSADIAKAGVQQEESGVQQGSVSKNEAAEAQIERMKKTACCASSDGQGREGSTQGSRSTGGRVDCVQCVTPRSMGITSCGATRWRSR
jgi:hypothetical protein